MKIKITKSGTLEIDGRFRGCPYVEGDASCGTWCALFKEPIFEKRYSTEYKDFMFLDLCYTTWTCDKKDFTDEREEVPDE